VNLAVDLNGQFINTHMSPGQRIHYRLADIGFHHDTRRAKVVATPPERIHASTAAMAGFIMSQNEFHAWVCPSSVSGAASCSSSNSDS
jgi:hypothetical protein